MYWLYDEVEDEVIEVITECDDDEDDDELYATMIYRYNLNPV